MAEVSFAPSRLDVLVTAGDALDVIVPLITEGGEPADLTGYTPRADAVGTATHARQQIAATIAPGGSGVRLRLTSAETAALDESSEWDLRLLVDGASVATPVAGALRARRPVTTIT